MDDTSKTKGRTVGCWLSGAQIDALTAAITTPAGKIKESTYGAEAIVQRLQREGHLKAGADSEVAAQAFELSRTFGADAVKAKLLELEQAHATSLPSVV